MSIRHDPRRHLRRRVGPAADTPPDRPVGLRGCVAAGVAILRSVAGATIGSAAIVIATATWRPTVTPSLPVGPALAAREAAAPPLPLPSRSRASVLLDAAQR